MRSTRTAGESTGPEQPVHWLDVDGEPIVPLSSLDHDDHGDPVESLREVGEWCNHQLEKVREVEAAPGPRFGQAADSAERSGSSEDVIEAVWLNPSVATAAAQSGEVFDPPIENLTIDSLEVEGRSCSCRATVRVGRFRKRTATLRIDPSPSGVFTILELVPVHARRYRTRSFVTAGVPAVSQLSDRLALRRVTNRPNPNRSERSI